MGVALVSLMAAPIVGAAGGWRALPSSARLMLAFGGAASLVLLGFSWRAIPGGVMAASLGHLALAVSIVALVELGRATRVFMTDPLSAAMGGLGIGLLLVIGIFALGPLTADLSSRQAAALLLANPFVAVTSAAGIDLLHLDTIYRTSPLAHRGVALPAWTTACVVYAMTGLAAHGVSRLRPWSH
ncbi:MAG: hypothetical protein EPO35_07965 [Acidobacteria bacterium]|nr:MAG: hypothetical protein EPO35_07965 [Acidobacteriota bacterium]